jgi:sulfur transfer complex TusBCD TusB component (DsrH family)
MALYLVDKRYADLALDMVKQDESGKIVFIQDGVYLKYSENSGREVYYVLSDVESRGVKDLPENARMLSYEELTEMMTAEKVYNFI